MKSDQEQYAEIASKILCTVLATVDLNVLGQIGHERVMTDVFDLSDAFCAELAARLARTEEKA